MHNLDLSQQNAICHKLDGAVTPYHLIMPNLKTNFLSQLKAQFILKVAMGTNPPGLPTPDPHPRRQTYTHG
jgi:hypothetical protein